MKAARHPQHEEAFFCAAQRYEIQQITRLVGESMTPRMKFLSLLFAACARRKFACLSLFMCLYPTLRSIN
jgi:hypothetical protein